MDVNPYESPRFPSTPDVPKEVDGLPYWPFLDVVVALIAVGVIFVLTVPLVLR